MCSFLNRDFKRASLSERSNEECSMVLHFRLEKIQFEEDHRLVRISRNARVVASFLLRKSSSPFRNR